MPLSREQLCWTTLEGFTPAHPFYKRQECWPRGAATGQRNSRKRPAPRSWLYREASPAFCELGSFHLPSPPSLLMAFAGETPVPAAPSPA